MRESSNCSIFLFFSCCSLFSFFMSISFSLRMRLFCSMSSLHIPSNLFCLSFKSVICFIKFWLGGWYTAILSSLRVWLIFLLMLGKRSFLSLLKLGFAYTLSPYSCLILLNPYMLSCLMKEEKLLCLKYLGSTSSVNLLISLMMKAFPSEVHEIGLAFPWHSVSSYKMLISFYKNKGIDEAQNWDLEWCDINYNVLLIL